VLMRLNRQYRAEASVLETSRGELPDLAKHERHRVVVFVDSVDLAEVEAMRYAKGLDTDDLSAVHFVLDEARAARLQVRWQRFGYDTELRMIDCKDRQLSRAAQQLVLGVKDDYPDATAGASAQIVAYDVGSRVARALRGADNDGPGRSPAVTGKTEAATQPASG
jgi:hypothetical protein